MLRSAMIIGIAALGLAACDGDGSANNSADAGPVQTDEAKDAAGSKTIASALGANSRFAGLMKSAGLDQTLAGPGPYTVLVPNDAALDKVPAETRDSWGKPEGRADLTRALTYHILPGFVLGSDIGKAIDNGKGKTVLMTMGGGTLNATREGGKIVLTDSKGAKATLDGDGERYSNGVVHHVDAVLTPTQG
jgi:uncharacterized surface protein with fasciclin (FAS1) repeats